MISSIESIECTLRTLGQEDRIAALGFISKMFSDELAGITDKGTENNATRLRSLGKLTLRRQGGEQDITALPPSSTPDLPPPALPAFAAPAVNIPPPTPPGFATNPAQKIGCMLRALDRADRTAALELIGARFPDEFARIADKKIKIIASTAQPRDLGKLTLKKPDEPHHG